MQPKIISSNNDNIPERPLQEYVSNPNAYSTAGISIISSVFISYTAHVYSSPIWKPLSSPASAPQAAIEVVSPFH